MVTRELTNRGQPLSYQFWIIFHTMKRRLYLTVLVRRIINGLTTFPLILWENRNIRMRYYCIIEFDSQHYIAQAFNKVWNMYGVTYLLHCIINWPNDYLFQPKSIILVRLPNIMSLIIMKSKNNVLYIFICSKINFNSIINTVTLSLFYTILYD